MFWTECLVQRTLFAEDEYRTSSTVSELIRFAEEAFPGEDANFHRSFAFLTHQASQAFLRPLLLSYYGSIDEAKVPTVSWLEELGSLETFARSTRARECNGKATNICQSRTPAWYTSYCNSGRYADQKAQAESFWRDYMGELHCSVNARHEYEVLHHSDYARIGEGDEFRYLVPLCHACHLSINARGPKVPSAVPESVKQWL